MHVHNVHEGCVCVPGAHNSQGQHLEIKLPAAVTQDGTIQMDAYYKQCALQTHAEQDLVTAGSTLSSWPLRDMESCMSGLGDRSNQDSKHVALLCYLAQSREHWLRQRSLHWSTSLLEFQQ